MVIHLGVQHQASLVFVACPEIKWLKFRACRWRLDGSKFSAFEFRAQRTSAPIHLLPVMRGAVDREAGAARFDFCEFPQRFVACEILPLMKCTKCVASLYVALDTEKERCSSLRIEF